MSQFATIFHHYLREIQLHNRLPVAKPFEIKDVKKLFLAPYSAIPRISLKTFPTVGRLPNGAEEPEDPVFTQVSPIIKTHKEEK